MRCVSERRAGRAFEGIDRLSNLPVAWNQTFYPTCQLPDQVRRQVWHFWGIFTESILLPGVQTWKLGRKLDQSRTSPDWVARQLRALTWLLSRDKCEKCRYRKVPKSLVTKTVTGADVTPYQIHRSSSSSSFFPFLVYSPFLFLVPTASICKASRV